MDVILVNSELKSINGEGFKLSPKDQKDVDLFTVCSEVLGNEHKDDQSQSFADKCKRLEMAEKFFKAKESGEKTIEISSEFVNMIEERAAKMLAGSCCYALKKALAVKGE